MAKEDVVLITGASGFIGSAIIRRLAEEYTLVGLDRAGPPDPPAPAHAVDFDLSSEPRRVCRRPQLLRGRGYDEQDDEQVLT